jgi:endonuclease/exonuclease/phosphatase family metal-dependent hydrolase
VAHLIRTWNVFHGNASPPRRRSYLRPAISLAIEGEPAVVCLQELPVWSLARLAAWSGYQVFGAVARRGAPPAEVSGWITRQWQGVIRSAIAGQANAILVRPDLHALPIGSVQVSDGPRERRVVQLARIAEIGLVANTHLTQRDRDATSAEIRRMRGYAEGHAEPGEAIVLAGDLNVPAPIVEGYSAAAPGLDQVLVCGAAVSAPVVWPTARRMHNGLVLSDHAPVEVCLR